MVSRLTLNIPNKSKSSLMKLSYLWISLIILIIAILISGFLSDWGQGSYSNQNQQITSQATCSDTVVGDTQEAPVGTIEHSLNSAVKASGLFVTVNSVNYLYSGVVNVDFGVTNNSSTLSSSELYDNSGVVGSNGKYYYACLAGNFACSYNFNSLVVKPGQSQTTCVAYLLPTNVLATEVEYLPPANSSNNYQSTPILWFLSSKSINNLFTQTY
jgi:hypothetical protein